MGKEISRGKREKMVRKKERRGKKMKGKAKRNQAPEGGL